MAFLLRARPAAGLAATLALVVACLALACAALSAPHAAAAGRCCTISSQTGSYVAPSEAHPLYLPLIVNGESIPNVWQAEYYANEHLGGDPAYVAEETRIDHDWGTGGPAGLPTNSFSARWTGSWEFEAGEYTFFAYADDGVRLYLNDEPVPIIDQWQPGVGSYQATTEIETGGVHKLRLEYFEHDGDAGIRLHWRHTDIYPQWQGTYYYNPWVLPGPNYSQIDSAIQFDWVTSCPDRLASAYACDSFSVAWTATPLLLTGTHRVHVYADDGYQLFVGGNKVAEGGWLDGQGGGRQDATVDVYVPSPETHPIVYNYHDRGGLAEARLWIEHLAYGDWYVEYYGNPDLNDPPLKTGSDESVFYSWGFGAPRPKLPVDGFSVRWSGERHFPAGCYRFGIFVDDGVRLWVDGELLIDEWHPGRAEYHSPPTFLSTGYHDVVIEYYELSGEAEIRFWWE